MKITSSYTGNVQQVNGISFFWQIDLLSRKNLFFRLTFVRQDVLLK